MEYEPLFGKQFVMNEKKLESKKIFNKTKTCKDFFEIETNVIPNHTRQGNVGLPGNCTTEDKLFKKRGVKCLWSLIPYKKDDVADNAGILV
jgi:hypothetical protein